MQQDVWTVSFQTDAWDPLNRTTYAFLFATAEAVEHLEVADVVVVVVGSGTNMDDIFELLLLLLFLKCGSNEATSCSSGDGIIVEWRIIPLAWLF